MGVVHLKFGITQRLLVYIIGGSRPRRKGAQPVHRFAGPESFLCFKGGPGGGGDSVVNEKQIS